MDNGQPMFMNVANPAEGTGRPNPLGKHFDHFDHFGTDRTVPIDPTGVAHTPDPKNVSLGNSFSDILRSKVRRQVSSRSTSPVPAAQQHHTKSV